MLINLCFLDKGILASILYLYSSNTETFINKTMEKSVKPDTLKKQTRKLFKAK